MNSLYFQSAARSAIGLIRNGNEDGALTHPRLLAVADGMGGHAGGEVASSIALLVLARRAAIFLDQEVDHDSADDLFNSSIDDIDEALKEASDEDPDLVGLGTTLTSLFIRNNQLALLHVGDSRLYRIQGSAIEQLSVDHTVMQELLTARTIAAKDASSGSSISSTVFPIQLEESGKVNSTRLAWPFRNENKRTTSPTLTASSTKAEIILGVDTATSTPHDESNSHSFLG